MNRESESTDHVVSGASNAGVREMFVTTDFGSIPASEMRPLLTGFPQWLSAVLTYKVLRSKAKPAYVIDLRRLIRAKHVPKRMQKHFNDLKAQLESLNFSFNFDATFPALGPYSSAIMAMSRRDGDLHFFATQIARKVAGQIEDEGYFGFTTWLSDRTSIVTLSPAHLPRPGDGVDRVIVGSDDPAVVLKKHRQRLRNKEIEPVAPADLFDRVESENQKQTEDLLRRGVIRVATTAEVTRIRIET